jgi:hypothetical protein
MESSGMVGGGGGRSADWGCGYVFGRAGVGRGMEREGGGRVEDGG